MSTSNKQVALDFFERLSRGEVGAALDLLADDATWSQVARAEGAAFKGTRTKAQFAELLGWLGSQLAGGIRLTATNVIAEGDWVAVEAESYAETSSGKIYNNVYVFVFEIRGGKIRKGREYFDTMHVQEVFG